MLKMFKALYAPVFFVSFVGTAILLVENGAPKWTLPLLFLGAIAVSFASERLAPYEPAWNQDKRDSVTNMMHATLNEVALFGAIVTLPLFARHVAIVQLWPHSWPLIAQLAIAIVLADLGITLAHYWSHRVSWIWRLHAVHHAAPRLYGFNGLMKHPVHQAIEGAFSITPLLLIGASGDVFWLLGFAIGVQLLLQHSNVDIIAGRLLYVWAIAPAHRHHHLASDTRGDVNFGLFLSIWDHMLGTFKFDACAPRDGQVGVAGRPDYPRNYAAHLVEPFRR